MELLTYIKELNLGDLIIILLAGVKVWDMGTKIVKKITGYHDEKQKEESCKEMVAAHEADIAEMRRDLSQLSAESRGYRLVSLKTKIFGYWEMATKLSFITRSQLEMFDACVEMYLELGGNGLVKEKFAPEVYALPVKELE